MFQFSELQTFSFNIFFDIHIELFVCLPKIKCYNATKDKETKNELPESKVHIPHFLDQTYSSTIDIH